MDDIFSMRRVDPSKINLELDYKEYKKNLVYSSEKYSPFGPGIQYEFRFPNGYGASVIKLYGSYGYRENLWELAVIKFGDSNDDYDYEINSDTGLTNDEGIIGYLNDYEVVEYLGKIEALAFA